jgi:hypothetical protein
MKFLLGNMGASVIVILHIHQDIQGPSKSICSEHVGIVNMWPPALLCPLQLTGRVSASNINLQEAPAAYLKLLAIWIVNLHQPIWTHPQFEYWLSVSPPGHIRILILSSSQPIWRHQLFQYSIWICQSRHTPNLIINFCSAHSNTLAF